MPWTVAAVPGPPANTHKSHKLHHDASPTNFHHDASPTMIFFGLVIGRQWLAQLFEFHQLCFVGNALVLLIPHRGWVDGHPLQQPLEL